MKHLPIHPPCSITPRLLPGIRVAEAWVSVETTGKANRYSVPEWRWFIDGPDFTDEGGELWTFGDHRDALGTLLTFLAAWSDPGSGIHDPGDPDHVSPFDAATLKWAAENNDEITITENDLSDEPL